MSMQPQPWPEPADDVAQAVQAMYAGRRAPLAVVVRDELDAVSADVEFAEAFAVRGQPGWSPGRLAMITVLLAVVRQLNQVELVGETVRACVEALAAAAPGWVAARLDVGWQRRYGARVDAWRMPASKT